MKGYSIKYMLADKRVLIPLSVFLFFGVFLLANFIFNAVLELARTTLSNLLNPQPFSLSFDYFFHIRTTEYPLFYGLFLIISCLVTLKFVYEMRSNFKDLNENQKGSSRFTTTKELKAQYKAVPEKTETYKGGGGVVISRMGKQLFIDDSPVNNLIIGTTRSGKGETFVFPTIDVYSRAENQPSLILNDPKGELFAASKDILEKRGFHIEVLNLLNPMESMSYNLLQLVIDAYKDGDYSTAQSLCKTLTHTLYYKPNVKDPFWQQCAMSLCNAMILAITDKCIKEGTEEKITMYAVANMLSELGSKEVWNEDKEEMENALDQYFESLPSDSVAKMQYATSNFSKGTTRGGIFTQTMNGLSIFTFDEIAKMTSKNSMDLKKVGFGKSIKGTATPFKRLKFVFPDGSKETLKTDSEGRFELNFKHQLKTGDHIQVYDSYDTQKKTIVSMEKFVRKTGETVFKTIVNNEQISIKQITYFDKPVAIFMITPDYDESNHVIASIFVRQLYFVLAKYASLARGGKCYREVVFILDEFGNMPSIEGMANIITVCLGRNIRFNLIIQAYAQLKNKYGDDAPTIDGNCGNTIYILTNDDETAEKISKKLGEKSINSISRSGKSFSLDKNKTESIDGRRLLTANELTRLKEGESVVYRVIKRQDQDRRRIKAYPIFNTGKTALKYRWEYLFDDFDTDKSILDVDIESLHMNVDPKDLLVDFSPQGLALESTEEVENPKEESQEKPKEPLSYDNWKTKTVAEFFEFDERTLKLIEEHLIPVLDSTINAIEEASMEEFWEKFKLIATNDNINRSVYQAVSGKITKIIQDLKESKEQEGARSDT